MILLKHPSTDKALELNRLFVEYQKLFGDAEAGEGDSAAVGRVG
jgi:hypothetical protein